MCQTQWTLAKVEVFYYCQCGPLPTFQPNQRTQRTAALLSRRILLLLAEEERHALSFPEKPWGALHKTCKLRVAQRLSGCCGIINGKKPSFTIADFTHTHLVRLSSSQGFGMSRGRSAAADGHVRSGRRLWFVQLMVRNISRRLDMRTSQEILRAIDAQSR